MEVHNVYLILLFSLRASSPIWASEVSLARTSERGAEERRAWLAIFSLRELHQTSPSVLRAETSSRYQSDPPENQIWHTNQAGASLACYQSTLISGTSFFSQWYFPSSGRSTNEILWEMVASSPFLGPSRLRRSIARSRETRFIRPKRRAYSQANYSSTRRAVWTLGTT